MKEEEEEGNSENEIEILDDKSNENIENDEFIKFDEIYPKNVTKKKKNTYREKFGDDNDLKTFHDSLLLNNHKPK